MFKNGTFAFVLVVVLVVSCIGIGIASAANNFKVVSLEEETSRMVQEVQKNPEGVAKEIVTNYFTEIMKKGDSEGVPLDSFRIVSVDNSNLNDISVSVILKYHDLDEWPAIDYSVVRINDRYQVQKQICVHDSVVNSPTKGTVNCSENIYFGNDGSVSITN
ncbi:hypothetical protein [Paenibacillus periandrae]|uniref:hypothetical protein n=1 Tax=Paenibacillus periandrae TaxID=1761741 RepID=UPI001F08EC98|nr:hypothetical protein [Paenibacillus periandrae]